MLREPLVGSYLDGSGLTYVRSYGTVGWFSFVPARFRRARLRRTAFRLKMAKQSSFRREQPLVEGGKLD